MAIGGWHLPILSGSPPVTPTDWQYWGSTGSNGIYDAMVTLLVNIDMDMDQISIGNETRLGIKDGKLFRLGLRSSTTTIDYEWTQFGSDTDWTRISAGFNHCMAIRAGRLYGWGSGTNGQLGDGTTSNYENPTQIGTDTDWEYISCGGSFSMAIKGGQLFGTGSNTTGRTGLGTTVGNTNTFTVANTDITWTDVDCANQHSAGINDGNIYTWGVNSAGRTGAGTASGSTTTPTQRGADTWSKVAAGAFHTLAINTTGELFACGQQASGRLGNGATATASITTLAKIGIDTDWEEISAYRHDLSIARYIEWSAAIKAGELYATGINTYGQLNIATSTANSGTFVQIGIIDDYIQVVAGFGYGLAKRNLI